MACGVLCGYAGSYSFILRSGKKEISCAEEMGPVLEGIDFTGMAMAGGAADLAEVVLGYATSKRRTLRRKMGIWAPKSSQEGIGVSSG